jgi:hypothetical protein
VRVFGHEPHAPPSWRNTPTSRYHPVPRRENTQPDVPCCGPSRLLDCANGLGEDSLPFADNRPDGHSFVRCQILWFSRPHSSRCARVLQERELLILHAGKPPFVRGIGRNRRRASVPASSYTTFDVPQENPQQHDSPKNRHRVVVAGDGDLDEFSEASDPAQGRTGRGHPRARVCSGLSTPLQKLGADNQEPALGRNVGSGLQRKFRLIEAVSPDEAGIRKAKPEMPVLLEESRRGGSGGECCGPSRQRGSRFAWACRSMRQ